MTFDFRDFNGDTLRVRPGQHPSLIAIEIHASSDWEDPTVRIPLDRVEELLAGVRDAARQAAKACRCSHPADEHSIYGCADDCACEWMPRRPTAARQATGQPAARREHPMDRALRLGATAIPDDVTIEICEATNSGVPLPWPQFTELGGELWWLTDEVHDGDHVMLPAAGDMQPMLHRDVERFFGPLTPAGQPVVEQPAEAQPADRACICGHTLAQHFEDACVTQITGCTCGDYMEPEAAREALGRWREAALKARSDRAEILREAAELGRRLSRDGYSAQEIAARLDRMAEGPR